MATINPQFRRELKKYGAFDFNACYNCGTCTATCTLSANGNSFPRQMVRYSTLGMEDDIKASLKPWMCYYCGDCTSNCPREANPGELMMSLRRWLTAQYDWTGLSGLLYRSWPLTFALFFLSAAAIVLYSAGIDFQLEKIMHLGHYFEMFAILTVFVVILLPNLMRMWWFTEGQKKEKAPLKAYINSISELFIHMFTQKQSRSCNDNQIRWVEHLILVSGYLLLLFTTVFLNWFASTNVFIIALGYLESAAVFIITSDFIRRRIVKEKEISRYSQPSDWLFVTWLFLMGFTAFMVRLLIDLQLLASNGWLYLVHIIVLAQWALFIVPFGKWTHFLYRSFAMYLDAIQKKEK